MNTQLSKWSLKQCGLVSKNHWNCLEVLRTSIPLNILCHHHSIDIWNCGPLVAWRGAVSSAFQSYQNLENNSGRCLRPATGQYAGHMAPYIGHSVPHQPGKSFWCFILPSATYPRNPWYSSNSLRTLWSVAIITIGNIYVIWSRGSVRVYDFIKISELFSKY